MPSPKLEAFALYHQSTGAALTGQAVSMSFLVYKDDQGTNVSAPSIVEIGGGWYGFVPTLPGSASRGLVYTLDTGPNGSPAKISRYVRPEDYNADAIPALQSDVTRLRGFAEGKWQVVAVGPDANRMVFYALDGVTVLAKFDLTDSSNIPTTVNPYKRSPVP